MPITSGAVATIGTSRRYAGTAGLSGNSPVMAGSSSVSRTALQMAAQPMP
jgi:hypothetical protein